uniref:Uncharacterized protein n=1 Tax=Cyanothece sp. (strain PCC 7425 / ATCC 29141) TaxID=395961 RepID=B8HMY9_CYAP4
MKDLDRAITLSVIFCDQIRHLRYPHEIFLRHLVEGEGLKEEVMTKVRWKEKMV